MKITRNNFLDHYPGHAELGHVIERNAAGRAVQIGDGRDDLNSDEVAGLLEAGHIFKHRLGYYVTDNGREKFIEGAKVFGNILRNEG